MMERLAAISDDGLYRWWLRRRWAAGETATWIMLNPSTADSSVDDPTIRRVTGFSKMWGYGAAIVFNLFAYRATNPADLREADDPVGEVNDAYLYGAILSAEVVVVGWGSTGDYATRYQRRQKVREIASTTHKQLHCLGVTKSGDPRHPLYVPYAQPLEVWP